MLEKHTPPDFEVFAENWEAVRWFLEVDDLFKTDGMIVLGLDVLAVQADAQMRGYDISADNYERLRTIGRAAASEINKKNNK